MRRGALSIAIALAWPLIPLSEGHAAPKKKASASSELPLLPPDYVEQQQKKRNKTAVQQDPALISPAYVDPKGLPPLEVDLNLKGQGLDHLVHAGSQLDCTGGAWTFDWAGRVPGETAEARALLAGDGMFFTEGGKQNFQRPPRLAGQGIRCTVPDGATGQPMLAFHGQLTPTVGAEVDVQVSMDRDKAYISAGFSDVAQCRVEMPGMSPLALPVGLRVSSAETPGPGAARFHQPVSFTEEELEKGFSKTWQLSAQAFAPASLQCMGQRMEGEITLRYKSAARDVQIDFNSCLHLAAGESRAVVAQGTPAGGRYAFSASPRPLIDAVPLGGAPNQASAIAQTPGRGEFTASYTVNGKSASKTVPASVVRFDGFKPPHQTFIEIGLWDADGQPTRPLNVGFRSEPAAAGDLLVFKPTSPAIIGVATRQQSVEIQALARGDSVLQAQTLCGEALPGQVLVRVVACSKETREALERRKQNAKQRNEAISKRVQELLNDPEFERVEREIEQDVKDLAFKTAYTIVSTLSYAQGRAVKAAEGRVSQFSTQSLEWLAAFKSQQAAVKMGKEVMSVYSTGSSLLKGFKAALEIGSTQGENSEAYKTALKGVVSGAVKLLHNDPLSLAKTYLDAAQSAQKMGRNVGTLVGVADRLAELDEQHDAVRKDWERVAQLIKRCDAAQPEAQEPELIAPPATERPRPGAPKPPGRKPVEIAVDPAVAPAPPPPKAPTPAPPPPTAPGATGSVPLCMAVGSKPAEVAASLRRAQSAYEAYAERLNRAVTTAAVAHQRALEALVRRAEEGPTSLRKHLPQLAIDHDQAFLSLAEEGDASLRQLEESQPCEIRLPGTAVDLKKIEWRLGP